MQDVQGTSSSRRLKLVYLGPEGLVDLCTEGKSVLTLRGLPEGARPAGLHVNAGTGSLMLFVEHPSFPEIEDGAPIEDVIVEFKSTCECVPKE